MQKRENVPEMTWLKRKNRSENNRDVAKEEQRRCSFFAWPLRRILPLLLLILAVGGCEKAAEQEQLFCTDPEYTTDIILSVVNRLWISICDMIITAEDQGKETDLYELLRLTDSCRTAVSRILSLPYGAISITDIAGLRDLCKQVHQHWPNRQ